MITRKKIDLGITTNSPEQFVRLGNVFPNINIFYNNFFQTFSSKFKTFMDIISENASIDFCRQYLYHNKLKTLSSFITEIIDSDSLQQYSGLYSLSDGGFQTISSIIERKYLEKWNKLWDTLNFEYNPIKPYDMTTKEKIGEKQGGTTSNSGSIDDSGSDTTTSKVILDKTEDSLYGFNSLEPVPSNKTENSSENLDSSESKNKSTSSNTTIHGRTNDINRELSRTGNIGNITQQELIKQERDIVQYIIWDTIYDDLNRVFTRSKYIY